MDELHDDAPDAKQVESLCERLMVERLHDWRPKEVNAILPAARGFGDQKRHGLLDFLGWDCVIRGRGNIAVQSADGEAKPADAWVLANGRAGTLDGAGATQDRALVPAVVVVEEASMDRTLQVNTVRRRALSLFRQGLGWYDGIPTRRAPWLRPLVEALDRMVRRHAVSTTALGAV